MPSFSFTDPEFSRKVTSPSELWRRDLALACGTDLASSHLGDPKDPHAPVAAVLTLPPRFEQPRHCHDCYRFEVIVRGSVIDEDGIELTAGDIRTSAPGEFYGPYTAGPDGLVSVEIFSDAARTTTWAEGEGTHGAAAIESIMSEVNARGLRYTSG